MYRHNVTGVTKSQHNWIQCYIWYDDKILRQIGIFKCTGEAKYISKDK
jgi:hypothetical protein